MVRNFKLDFIVVGFFTINNWGNQNSSLRGEKFMEKFMEYVIWGLLLITGLLLIAGIIKTFFF